MFGIYYAYALFGGVVLSISALSIIALINKKFSLRTLSTVSFLSIAILCIYIGIIDIIGRPKPIILFNGTRYTLDWFTIKSKNVEKSSIVGYHITWNDSIYLTLLDEGGDGIPRLYKYPWNEQMAKALEKKSQENSETGGRSRDLVIIKPYEPSLEWKENRFEIPLPPSFAPKPKLEYKKHEMNKGMGA